MTTDSTALQSEEQIAQTLNALAHTARAEAVFGQPAERNGHVVISCSEVVAGLGIGTGRGSASQGENGTQESGGGGGGGGGWASGRPVAAIVISQDDVRVLPIIDGTKITLAALTTGTFILLQLFQLFRRSQNTRLNKPPSLRQIKKATQR